MKARNREISIFSLSLMDVISGAMGAFLVIMLLLLPYYTPNLATQQDLEEIILQLKKARESIETVSRQLDPASGGGGAQASLKEATSHIELTAQVVRKMRALLDRTLAQVAKLKAENERLLAENRQLQNQLRAAEQEIQRLKEELERLKDRQEQNNRPVVVSVTSTDCHGVWLSGIILPVREKLEYTWTKNEEPIEPEHMLFAHFGDTGGDITRYFKKAGAYADRAAVRKYVAANNAIILTDTDVQQDPHVVGIFKRHPRRKWEFRDSRYNMITPSENDCTVTFTATAKVGGRWEGVHGQSATVSAKVAGAALFAITSDEKGIAFRPVTEAEDRWFDSFVLKSLAAQDAWLKANPGKDLDSDKPSGKDEKNEDRKKP